MIEKIRQALIESDMSPRDLRIALDIIAQIEEQYKDVDVTIVYGPPTKTNIPMIGKENCDE